MPNKSNKKKPSAKQRASSRKNITDWNNRVEESSQRQLDVQKQLSAALDHQLLTGEKLSRKEQERLSILQEEVDKRLQTNNLLGRANIIGKKKLDMLDEEFKILNKIIDKNTTVTDLYKEFVDTQHKLVKTKKEGVKTILEERKVLLKNSIQEKLKLAVHKKYVDKLKEAIPLLNKANDLVKNPLKIVPKIGSGLINMGKDWNDQLQASYGVFGAMGPVLKSSLADKIGESNAKMAHLNISFKEVAGYVGPISTKLGIGMKESVGLAFYTGEMAKTLGVSGEELINLENIYTNVVGLSHEQFDTTIRQQKAWLMTSGVVPQAVLKDMASSTEIIARYTSHMGTNLLNASTQAIKLGVNLSTIDRMSNSVLNFQQSIRDEFELSVLLGKRVDLRMTRIKFLGKDMTGGFEELRKQLSGTDLKSLDSLTVEKLANSFNLTYEQLDKVIQTGGKLDDLEKATSETLKKQNIDREKAENAQTKLAEALNTYNNLHRTMNKQMRDNWENIEGFASKFTTAMQISAGFVSSIGILLASGVVSMAAMALEGWSYARAMQVARNALNSGAYGVNSPHYTGGHGQGTSNMKNTGGYIPGQSPRGLKDWRSLKSSIESSGGKYRKGDWAKYKASGLNRSAMPRGGSMGSMRGGLIAMGVGIGSNLVRNMLPEEHKNGNFGKGLGIASSMATMAGTGAMVGSMIPGIGTAVGGIAGGILGLLQGLNSEGVFDKKVGKAHSGGVTSRGGLLNVLPQEAIIPLDKIGDMSSSNKALSSSSRGNNVEIDYNKLAYAVRKGSTDAFRDHGIPNITDERIWRGADKISNTVWAPSSRG